MQHFTWGVALDINTACDARRPCPRCPLHVSALRTALVDSRELVWKAGPDGLACSLDYLHPRNKGFGGSTCLPGVGPLAGAGFGRLGPNRNTYIRMRTSQAL